MAETQTNVDERRKELGKLSRTKLDEEAVSVGIEDPKAFGNAEEVVDAIISHEAKVEREAVKEAERQEHERNPRYSHADLLANPSIAGARRHIVFAALQGNDQEFFTAKEAKKLVKDFRGQKDTTREEAA